MTPDDLTALIEDGDRRGVVRALEGLDEKSRRALAPAAKSWLKENGARWRFDDEWRACAASARLAALGTFTWTECRRVEPFNPFENEVPGDDVADVLLARRPKWVARWLEWRLSHRPEPWAWSGQLWTFIRRVIADGSYDVDRSDDYVRLLGGSRAGSGYRYRDESPSNRIKSALLADPELLEDEFWRLLEIDVGEELMFRDETSDAAHGPQTWLTAIAELVSDGHLDRDRVIDTLLSTLRQGPHRTQAAWRIRVYERISPTDEEVAAREPAWVTMLGDPMPAVATFAGKQLLRFEPQSSPALLESLASLFECDGVAPSEAGFRIAKRLGHLAARSVAAALAHPKPTIQKRAVEFLDSHCADPDEELADVVETYAADSAPSVRASVGALISRLRPDGARREPSRPVLSPNDLQDLRARASALANDTSLGLSALLDGELTAVDVAPMKARRLIRPVAPIADRDELIDALLHEREHHVLPSTWERVLDGVSRLLDPRDRDLDALLGPVEDSEQPSSFAHLLAARRGVKMQREPPNPEYGFEDAGPHLRHFVHRRLYEVAQRLLVGHMEPVLALPTHAGGWIAPTVLVERLLARPAPARYDLIQALLRVAPDGRHEALGLADRIGGSVGEAVRWALGAEHRPADLDDALLIAASRARDPWGDFGAERLGPDGLLAARYTWRHTPVIPWKERKGPSYDDGMDRAYIRVDAEPNLGERRDAHELVATPTVLLHRLRRPREWWANECEVLDDGLLGLWPLNPDPFMAWGVVQISHDLDAAASPYLKRSTYLRPLFDPNTRFSNVAQLLLAVSFAAADADVRVSALDAAIALVGDGRMTGDEVGTLLAELVKTGMFKTNRIADALGELARHDVLCAFVGANALQSMLAEEVPKRPLPLLEQLRELLAELNSPLRADARAALEALPKKSRKTGSAITELLAQNGEGRCDEILALAIEGRLARAGEGAA